MIRCRFGAGLLIVLLIISLAVAWSMAEIHEPIAEQLHQAAEAAQRGDWEKAERLSGQAVKKWEKWDHFRSCFADHTPAEEIDAELAAMQTAVQERERANFTESCVRASKMVQAVGDAHALLWWNLF